ncbi:baculoviral IAP repeat-containing protein 3-like [Babylonia areolata]|uniref:baculoviral IAP repeat-containing protein 3-like n=1 Tax=Babylonia areolata TaxID=304850 RepID=UPI003FD39005
MRLASLGNFPAELDVSRIKLADAGFYSIDDKGSVKCYSCSIVYSDWKKGDKPLEVHKRISPECQHVLEVWSSSDSTPTLRPGQQQESQQESKNDLQCDAEAYHPVSGPPPASTSASASFSFTSADLQGISSLSISVPQKSISVNINNTVPSRPNVSQGSSSADSTRPTRPMFPVRGLDLQLAVYPMYSQKETRVRTFRNIPWDEMRCPPLMEIVNSGMYYAGYEDCVRCFYCGLGLKRWEPEDDVWEAHATWRGECEYLRRVKGDTFVQNIWTRNDPAFGRTEVDSTLNRSGGGPNNTTANGGSTGTCSGSSDAGGNNTTSGGGSSNNNGEANTNEVVAATANETVAAATTNETVAAATTNETVATATTNETTAATTNETVATATTNKTTATTINEAVTMTANEALAATVVRSKNKNVEKMFKCRICKNAGQELLFLPCGHIWKSWKSNQRTVNTQKDFSSTLGFPSKRKGVST